MTEGAKAAQRPRVQTDGMVEASRYEDVWDSPCHACGWTVESCMSEPMPGESHICCPECDHTIPVGNAEQRAGESPS